MSDPQCPPPERGAPARDRPRRPRVTEAVAPPEDWVTIGQIVAVFGVQGAVKARSQSDIPHRFRQGAVVYLGPDHQPFRLKEARSAKEDLLVLRLAGIESATAAQAVIGQAITIPLAQLAVLPADHYYIHDLIGLRVESLAGHQLGVITDILATGANDVYLVREPSSGREVLVPAVKAIVKRVDLPAGVMTIDPLPGLFDDRFEADR